mgnify:CR=1 FL=1
MHKNKENNSNQNTDKQPAEKKLDQEEEELAF